MSPTLLSTSLLDISKRVVRFLLRFVCGTRSLHFRNRFISRSLVEGKKTKEEVKVQKHWNPRNPERGSNRQEGRNPKIELGNPPKSCYFGPRRGKSLRLCEIEEEMKEGKSAKSNSNHQQLKQELQQQHHQNGGHLSPFKLTKLLDPEASWDKDQLGDVLHWIRQVVGLLCGLLFGAIPVVGGIWIVAFLLISSAIVYAYYGLVLKIDEEDFGGHGTLLQEGLFASITLFLLSWILVYSLAHF